MATEAIDNRIMTALFTILSGISGPPTYLTAPIVIEAVPPDAVPTVDPKPIIYLTHVRTDPGSPPAGTSRVHYWIARFGVWIAAKDQRTGNSVRADVLRALYAGEAVLGTSFQQPAYPLEFTRFDEANKAGISLGLQILSIEYQTDHVTT